MEFHEWARTLGAIGTTLSAIIAVVTYVKATKISLRAAETEKALRIRERLQGIVVEIQKLQVELQQGTALISAVAAVAHEIEARLSPVTSKQEIEEVLSNDPLLLSVSITGWHKSRAGVEVSERITRIELDVSQVTGRLTVFNELVELLAAAINNSCSPLILYKILTSRQQIDALHFDLSSDQRTKRLIDQVVVALQSNATAYYLSAYDKAVKTIRQFIETLVIALCALPNEQLVTAAEVSPKRRVEAATKPASIRQRLREIDDVFSIEDKNALSALIDNIEAYLSKDRAMHEFHQVTKTKT